MNTQQADLVFAKTDFHRLSEKIASYLSIDSLISKDGKKIGKQNKQKKKNGLTLHCRTYRTSPFLLYTPPISPSLLPMLNQLH